MTKFDFPDSFYDSVKVSTFLEVDAASITIKNAFLHDENDRPIDCNIYHPKYGSITTHNKYGSFEVRLGFLTDTKETIITSCNYIYDSYHTSEVVYCQFSPLSVLCIQDDGSLTNKDGVLVKKVDWHRSNQKRNAIDVNDFKEIYNREFDKNNLEDTASVHTTFKKILIKHLTELIKLHEDNREYGSTLDVNILAKAHEFIEWLEKGSKKPIEGNLFIDEAKTQIYLDILKNTTKPSLDGNGFFIKGINSKTKSPISAWLKYLTDKGGIINTTLSQSVQTDKVNELIPNLEISSKSLFTSYYAKDIEKLINAIQ